jgi:hypothetical protein
MICNASAACSLLIATRHMVSAAEPVILPIVFHVAELDGRRVVDKSFVDERLARANEIFAPYAVGFAESATLALSTAHAAIETRSDRDALSGAAKRGAIDCFVVRSLRDVDDPTQMRRGVHWHSRTRAGTHFVIVSSIAGRNVLAHEIGHYLGNPKHSQTPGNLMSYLSGTGLPVLDSDQVARMNQSVRDYLKRRELRAVAKGAPSAAPP